MITVIRNLLRAFVTPSFELLRDRDFSDIGLPRGFAVGTAGRAPFDVPNDRS